MNVKRVLKHVLLPRWWVKRAWNAAVGADVALAVRASERRHRGELRVVIEGPLPLASLRTGHNARSRALEMFSRCRVWDTAENTGILIYIQLVDRRVEILADRGIAACVPQAEWDGMCRQIEAAFRAGNGHDGVIAAVMRAGDLLAEHFPARVDNPNELADAPVVL